GPVSESLGEFIAAYSRPELSRPTPYPEKKGAPSRTRAPFILLLYVEHLKRFHAFGAGSSPGASWPASCSFSRILWSSASPRSRLPALLRLAIQSRTSSTKL